MAEPIITYALRAFTCQGLLVEECWTQTWWGRLLSPIVLG